MFADRSDTPLTIGLDINGPGGGQWQVLLRGDRPEDVERGLPSAAAAVLTTSTEDWQRLSRLAEGEAVHQLSGNLEILNGIPAESLAGCMGPLLAIAAGPSRACLRGQLRQRFQMDVLPSAGCVSVRNGTYSTMRTFPRPRIRSTQGPRLAVFVVQQFVCFVRVGETFLLGIPQESLADLQ